MSPDSVHAVSAEVWNGLPGRRKIHRSVDRRELEGEEENNIHKIFV
jgi:hypothetical protein